ncbi:hypothetical protein [Dactylosporangium matsuzakiense]|uniref:hypothetical protein n=1 Tax=Dactylosporangium matsuzakiense TaxID=53360 RepID=UPI0021C4897F|nr:hypothetical protein [Dactylosporangium matsuzakiense]
MAIDRPLTDAEQGELRAVSTRGRISASSFVNDYQWGDLKADPRKWMERYFDAHLYLANWGSRRIALRLPAQLLDPDLAATYCVGHAASSWAAGEHVILDLCSEDEDGDEAWWDEETALASIVPVRAELAAGDHRLLYLAWLLCVQDRQLDEDALEPPVPPGLGTLSGPLRSLAAFLRLDEDLLATAARASAPLTTRTPSAAALAKWVRRLPVADKDEAIVRLLRGDGAHLRAELLRRYGGGTAQAMGGGRTVGELLAGAETRWAGQQRQAEERAAAERARREAAAAAAREQRLDALAADPEQAWQHVAELIATKKPKEYDSAVGLLIDLQALGEREGQRKAFRGRMHQLRLEHARKPSLLDRLERAGLIASASDEAPA